MMKGGSGRSEKHDLFSPLFDILIPLLNILSLDGFRKKRDLTTFIFWAFQIILQRDLLTESVISYTKS